MVAVGGGEEKTFELSKWWLFECVHFLSLIIAEIEIVLIMQHNDLDMDATLRLRA